nr:hypothetical protein [uncultured Anaerobutyricum sp.]
MAGKNTNIISKTLVESYVRKQVKALKQSPTETIDTLTKQLLDKPKGSLEKYLLHITPEKLQDTQSGYYKLFHDILPKINTDHLVTLGMNIGYNGIFTVSKHSQTNSPESKSVALWVFMLSIDGINYEKKSAQYKAQISNAKKNGTRCFMLFIEKNAWKLLPLIKKEKDCAFFLFCPASCLIEKFLDAAKLTKNLFISVAYNSNGQSTQIPSTDVFKRLRTRKLPYAVHYYYSASDVENIKSGEIFKELSKERPLFSFFLSKKSDSGQDSVTEEDKRAVYEVIIKERYWLTYPSIPFAI